MPKVSKLWPVTALERTKSFCRGLLASTGMDILVASLKKEMCEPESSIICVSVPSTSPFTYEVKGVWLTDATVISVSVNEGVVH